MASSSLEGLQVCRSVEDIEAVATMRLSINSNGIRCRCLQEGCEDSLRANSVARNAWKLYHTRAVSGS